MPSQTTVNISLPESMREWVEGRVQSEGYGTVSEYFRALVREEQRRQARATLDEKLIEAINSGESREMTAADWDHIRSEVRRRLGKRRDSK